MLSAKLLDALTREMEDVVQEMTKRAIGGLKVRMRQPGSLPTTPRTVTTRPPASVRRTLH